jgi:Uma2 family endonuclease
MVLSEELATALKGASRSTVTIDMPPPQLVVEVVSPGKENADRDYRYKRSEYAARGIAEYWIVDRVQGRVTVLEWVEGLYEDKVFQGNEQIVSGLFGVLQLTAAQILQGR